MAGYTRRTLERMFPDLGCWPARYLAVVTPEGNGREKPPAVGFVYSIDDANICISETPNDPLYQAIESRRTVIPIGEIRVVRPIDLVAD